MNKIVVYTDNKMNPTKDIDTISRLDSGCSMYMLALLKYILDNYDNLPESILFIDSIVNDIKNIDSKLTLQDSDNLFLLGENIVRISKNYILRSSFGFYLDIYNRLIRNEITQKNAYDEIINGNTIKYVKPKFIVCMTTCRLKDDAEGKGISVVFERTIHSLYKYTKDLELYVIDDGSTNEHKRVIRILQEKYGFNVVFKEKNGGISKAKNSCLNIFKKSDAECCILIDDDITFIRHGWEDNYFYAMKQTNYHQLCLNALEYIGRKPDYIKINGLTFNKCDHTTGCLIVIDKLCLETLGGFHVFAGKWGGEHHNYYNRAQKAEITLDKVFLDVYGSSEYVRLDTQYSSYTFEEKSKMLEINSLDTNTMEIFRNIEE